MDVSSFLKNLKEKAALASSLEAQASRQENSNADELDESSQDSDDDHALEEALISPDGLGALSGSRKRSRRVASARLGSRSEGEDFSPLKIMQTNAPQTQGAGALPLARRGAAVLAAARARLGSAQRQNAVRNTDEWHQAHLAQKKALLDQQKALNRLQCTVAAPEPSHSETQADPMAAIYLHNLITDETGETDIDALLAASESPASPLPHQNSPQDVTEDIVAEVDERARHASPPGNDAPILQSTAAEPKLEAVVADGDGRAVTSTKTRRPVSRGSVTYYRVTVSYRTYDGVMKLSVYASILQLLALRLLLPVGMHKYLVGKSVGEGQFGSIREGAIKETGAPVVVKIIRVGRLGEGMPHPVVREAVISPRLDHPHVVRTLEVFTEGTSMVLVMERCHATVAELLSHHSLRSPVPENTLLRGYGGAIFSGDGDISQLSLIFSTLGTPDEETAAAMPDWGKIHFGPKVGDGIESVIPYADPLAVDVLNKLLCLNPKKRYSAREAINHPYFMSVERCRSAQAKLFVSLSLFPLLFFSPGLFVAVNIKEINVFPMRIAQGRALTKIVCTMGPSSYSVPVLKEMIIHGMAVARLNFSHGDYNEHIQAIEKVRAASSEVQIPVGIALDTKGPEIRTGEFVGGAASIRAGGVCTLTTSSEVRPCGTSELFFVDYPRLPRVISPGGVIFVDDGNLQLRVLACEGGDVRCEALNSYTLANRRGINLPGAAVDLPPMSDKDRQDIAFAVEEKLDFVFASFIRTAEHVRMVRQAATGPSKRISVFSKIESQQALDNIDDIIDASDGILVRRLVVEQKRIIRKCKAKGKPVICATQMMESMMTSSRPTRPEVADVTNAVLDGVDATMLSGESAKGAHPVDVVRWMSLIARTAQSSLESTDKNCGAETSALIAISRAGASVARAVGAVALVCYSSVVAKALSASCSSCPILLITSQDNNSDKELLLWRGVEYVVTTASSREECDAVAMAYLREGDLARSGETAVFVYGDSDASSSFVIPVLVDSTKLHESFLLLFCLSSISIFVRNEAARMAVPLSLFFAAMAPLTDKTVGFLGCGNMAECILAGLIRTEALLPQQVFVCNRTEAKMQRLCETYGVRCGTAEDLVENCQAIFIGVKPWGVVELLGKIRGRVKPDTLIVSMAAGITIKTVVTNLFERAKVVRVMPNLPCFVGMGATSVSGNENTTEEEVNLIAGLFNSVGKSFITDESAIHGVIGAAGSAPAYVFMFMEALSDAAVRGGIPRAQAYEMVTQAVMGSARMMQEVKKSPGELKDMVCTPGGTTIEAVRFLEKGGLRSTVMEAALACIEKSKELERMNNA
eukprot:gene9148-6429_t